ncbi:hypothetical protein P1J78_15465 [Psychromarinibacter sp. C21-152]|uniref:Uncharacterized protein n=1 Tax=Psychromarinibacter sediminicola TaxID=3033385 RepID=A0AAE3T9F4_9RHOB|nr:hypothetical protein [Psychromarinibacter sediminicola]MDF0602137.1 hypothetical protein [Psychromarinibacter sediminicola]
MRTLTFAALLAACLAWPFVALADLPETHLESENQWCAVDGAALLARAECNARRVAVAERDNGDVFVLYAIEAGTWSALSLVPDVRACQVAGGEGLAWSCPGSRAKGDAPVSRLAKLPDRLGALPGAVGPTDRAQAERLRDKVRRPGRQPAPALQHESLAPAAPGTPGARQLDLPANQHPAERQGPGA